jgi:hypothetical protein
VKRPAAVGLTALCVAAVGMDRDVAEQVQRVGQYRCQIVASVHGE